MKGFVIAGTGSGVGKTSIATGIMHTLSKRMKVQGFKVGPDFIDPLYHTAATGRRSGNLDTFMMSKDTMEGLAHYNSKGSDITILEGVRGLYEGSSGVDDTGSTAEIAKALDLPIILVVNVRSLTRSATAIVNGFKAFDREIDIAGVILNQVSGDQHERKLREAFEAYSDVDIFGVVRRDTNIDIEERYLGLDTTFSKREIAISHMADLTKDIDTDALISIARGQDRDMVCPYHRRDSGLKAAIPLDDAYCFYFRENIECMEASGIEIEYFSPINGDMLPDADIFYLGGGYPELYMDRISENEDFLQGLKTASEDGKVVIGECGGLMTMCSSITNNGIEYRGSGIFDAKANMVGIRHGPSYVVSAPNGNNPLFKSAIKGHEFHYSEITPDVKGAIYGYDVVRGNGILNKKDGLVKKNSIGTYMHSHALSVEDWMKDVCECCR